MYKKVFIIDDDEVSVFLTEMTLATENFALRYDTFLNPTDALELLLPLLTEENRSCLPDIVFLDLNMPFMSGWDFLETLQPYSHLLQGNCKIYILSSSVDAYEMERAKNYSLLTGFLHKPICEKTIHQLTAGQ
ncbi:response regulator [Pontibacter akesuensis]|uniref:CheY chemotaxis protein or a CheY-like REC (Receiver) domain n=1 Tax=Pontibacter akesuensis TaxID=388950 RepID=A0A1I7GSN7_9BACT|nr:response regulator [Pontibacter akesuensis]GHA55265.1 response regulator [Pontibacter akesuensis]SFU51473.1 CheY chemotaxis protein or a CheY-like REC (receiver) domain [Pontibacter akesuensis]